MNIQNSPANNEQARHQIIATAKDQLQGLRKRYQEDYPAYRTSYARFNELVRKLDAVQAEQKKQPARDLGERFEYVRQQSEILSACSRLSDHANLQGMCLIELLEEIVKIQDEIIDRQQQEIFDQTEQGQRRIAD